MLDLSRHAHALPLDRARTAGEDDLRAASVDGRGRDLLVEAPSGPFFPLLVETVRWLQAQRYRVVLVSPERCPSVQQQPELLRELVREGVLVSVCAAQLLPGSSSTPEGRTASHLVLEGLAQLVTSDGSLGPDARRAATTAVEQLAGPKASWLCGDVPLAVLRGDRRLPPEPIQVAGEHQVLGRAVSPVVAQVLRPRVSNTAGGRIPPPRAGGDWWRNRRAG